MNKPSWGRLRYITTAVWLICVGWGHSETSLERAKTDIWQDALIHPFDSIVLTEPQIDRFLVRLSQTNPQRAAELGKMRITHPQQFRWEIREELSERFFQRIQPPAAPEAEPKTPAPVPAEPAAAPDEAALQKQAELIAWLENHFPRQAEELKANPPPSAERIDHLFVRYEPMMRAERSNPPLAEVMKEDFRVQMHRDELLMELQYAEGDERGAIVKAIEDLVAKRFDLIIRKRELQHEQLHRRLDLLQEELGKQKRELDALKETREHSVNARVKELLNSVETANWE